MYPNQLFIALKGYGLLYQSMYISVFTGANWIAGVEISTCNVKTERWRQLIFASPFSFDITQVTRKNVIHNLVEISTPASRLVPMVLGQLHYNKADASKQY